MSTVLIVDDEESIQAVTTAILKKHGYATLIAQNADEAERLIAAGGVDIALVDIVMPGKGGLDLLMTIREKHPDLPVIVMSGKIRTDVGPIKKLAAQFGARCILAKPFSAQDLLESIRAVLESGCAS